MNINTHRTITLIATLIACGLFLHMVQSLWPAASFTNYVGRTVGTLLTGLFIRWAFTE